MTDAARKAKANAAKEFKRGRKAGIAFQKSLGTYDDGYADGQADAAGSGLGGFSFTDGAWYVVSTDGESVTHEYGPLTDCVYYFMQNGGLTHLTNRYAC